MKEFNALTFTASRAWGSELLCDFGDVTVHLHWTDQPFHWHANSGHEVFAVLDGSVDMHVREAGTERVIRLEPGQGITFEDGDEHVAHPIGEARILVVERKETE